MTDVKRRPDLLQEVAVSCRRHGFFQVTNHGIPQKTLDGALSAAADFFNLPAEDKVEFMSNDVHRPVRYQSSMNVAENGDKYQRTFLKHYSHPRQDWIGLWPDTPSDYRGKMGEYAEESQKLAEKLAGLMMESLGLDPEYLKLRLENGMQVIAVNCYSPCSLPHLTVGLPAHSDYSCLTIVLQGSPGLQFFNAEDESWRAVPATRGVLHVHVGDPMEVLSNGKYKSLVHRVVVDESRISIAGLHALAMDEKMEVAVEMVEEEVPKGYKESCFRDFLEFISKSVLGENRSFLQTLKL